MDPTPEDIERGTIEEIAVFSINAKDGTLTLKSVGDFQVSEGEEGKAEEDDETDKEKSKEQESNVPSEDQTLEDFMAGFDAQQSQ